MKADKCEDCIERRQLDLLQRIGRVGYWEYDPEEKSMMLGAAAQDLLAAIIGGPVEAGQPFLAALGDSERKRFLSALDEAVAGRLALTIELDLARGDGKPCCVVVRGAPVEADQGLHPFAGTFQNITNENTRQRDVMKTIIDNFPGGISLCDSDLRFTAYNDQFIKLLDFPPALFAKGWVDLEDLARYNAERGEYGPGDPEELVKAVVERARNFKVHQFERLRPNGTWLEIRGTPIASGGFVTSYLDITDRKQIEAELVHAKETAEARREQVASLLDNSGQGFLSFAGDLMVAAEFSRACETMLGTSPAGRDAAEVLFAGDAVKSDLLCATIPAALAEDDPWLCQTMLSLLPHEFRHGDMLLKAEYKRVENRRVMVVLTDVTGERRLEREVESERRRLEMIVAAVTDSRDFFDTVETFRKFFADGLRALLAAPAEPAVVARELYRQVHTFKGLMNQFGFPQTPVVLHDLEGRLEALRQRGGGVSRQDILDAVLSVPFEELLEADLAVLRDALGPEFMEFGDRIIVTSTQVEELQQLAGQLLRGGSTAAAIDGMRKLLLKIGSLRKVSLRDAVGGYDRLIRQTAARLEKEVLPLEVLGGADVLVDPRTYQSFLRSLTHIFRNAVTHGIEDPETRLRVGKEEAGAITCTIEVSERGLELCIADNGAGIDVEALRRCAVAAGLADAGEIDRVPDERVLDLIFLDNISTHRDATELAGRGVGLAVVRSEARKLGGDVGVRTAIGQGAQFRFTLPLQAGMIDNQEA